MPIKVSPVHASLGARITGVDLSAPLSGADLQDIHQAWLEYIVLIFADQNLSDEAQLNFSLNFGSPPDRPIHSKGTQSDDQIHKSVMLVSNIRDDGKTIGSLPDGEMHFHTDGAYERDPYRYTMLHALEVPKRGGNTLFANMYKAYEMLPKFLKSKLADVDAKHGFYTGVDVSKKMRANLGISKYKGTAEHPVFICHEETGRTALYVNRLLTEALVGFTQSESTKVLSELFSYAERPEIIYEHVWSPGDFVVWDNRCANHARTDFGEGERRLLRRTTVQGTRPERATINNVN